MVTEAQFDNAALSTRVRVLERRLRLLAAMAAMLAMLVGWLHLRPSVNEVRATRFTLLDEAGRERGMWRVQDGVAALVIRDAERNWRAIIAVGGEGTAVNGARLEVNGTGHDGSLAVVSTENGRPGLWLWDDRDTDPRVSLETGGGAPLLLLEATDGATRRVTPGAARTDGRE